MTIYLDLESNNNALPGFTHKFQSSILEADHPPPNDISNKVATTGWVASLLEGNALYPLVTKATDLSINVSEGYITNPQGEQVLVSATTTSISVVGEANEYVYIRYLDNKPVVSTIQPSSNQGFLLAIVSSDNTQITNINQVTPSPLGWASNDSPFFTGEPQAPTPPPGDCSNAIATTEYICQIVQALLNNQVMGNSPNLVDAGGLNVNVTNGEVITPEGETCNINPLITAIGLSPNSLEYIYVRYIDCNIVASTSAPTPSTGKILGTVETDDVKIINISQLAGSLSGLINGRFAVGFGGNLLPITQ